MPWAETDPMDQRAKFIEDVETGLWTMSELCERFGISRKTGYKLLGRVRSEGARGLRERSRRPRTCPHATEASVVEAILETKLGHPTWGARKVRRALRDTHPELAVPARSTVFGVLDRHGFVRRRRRRKQWIHPGRPVAEATAANQLWAADFKGQFRTRNGVYCYPLTITDQHSRYLVGCEALLSVRTEEARPVLERVFREVGLPEAIRTDNGAPFASTGIHGLCEMNVWWLQLGIRHQRIQPSHPEQNGAHERMHKTLKAETTRPPQRNQKAQQEVFDRWRAEYNQVRPHEALGDEPPATAWRPSPREYPKRMPEPDYPGHFLVRLVSNAGTFRFQSRQVFLSNALKQRYIGLEEIDDGIWSIYFYDVLLARMDERDFTLSA